MRKIWQIREQDLISQDRLMKAISISPIIAQLLVNRNIKIVKDAEFFLNPSLLNLHDPFLMKSMAQAVARIKRAISGKEKILIYGDYDVDGISATALLSTVLKRLKADVDTFIPSRLEDGYGLSAQNISSIHKRGIELIITVDCGITAIVEVDILNSLGIDIIITDHHTPGDKLPDTDIILNPLQEGCSYPDKNLAGVGVAFKLASGLLGKDDNWLYEQLDLVSLGTVADVVPLIGENRILVKNGLSELTHTKKEGLRALIEESYLKGKEITSYHVGYILAPRINAAGRLGKPEVSLELLLTDNPKQASELAKMLTKENRSRQKMEDVVLRQAMARIETEVDFTRQRVIVLEGENWHKGIIGIVASRIVDRFYRPTVMISMDGDEGRGSCRSIRNFNLVNALSECSDFLKRYGGHKNAAGLTIDKMSLNGFKEKINLIANERISDENLIPSIKIDTEIPISSLSKDLLEDLDSLGPFGFGNPRPVFSSQNLSIRNVPQVLRRSTLKMWVTDGNITAEAIGFNMADSLPSDPLKQRIDLAYSCDLNTYKGITSIKLQIKDMRVNLPSACKTAVSTSA
ncbi:MAG: single-stranded-DNA-specific exonuclease RecJ [Candidatus Orphnella occulta]|nr:single-stranded-DNA-specific exonuclease RecJ [Candidatus Orphnella occulta]MDP8296570.1 single-stranded-DNA-specific exonuclease RecJ [Candidatus Orphnella occulta]